MKSYDIFLKKINYIDYVSLTWMSASKIICIDDHDLDLEHRRNITILTLAYCYIKLALLFHYYIISINWLVSSLNFVTTKVSHKSVILTLNINTNCECYKVCIRLFWLKDIKWMKKNTKITCLSLLHDELWYIFEKKLMTFKTMVTWHPNPISQVGIMEKRILLCFLFPTTPNLCL